MVDEFDNPNFTESVNGNKIAWYDFGGQGQDLIISHASGFAAAVYEPLIELLKERFRVIAYDTRGHGNSDIPKNAQDLETWNWNRLSDDLGCVIKESGIISPIHFGHSSGATAGLLYQQKHNVFPAMVEFEPVLFNEDIPRKPDMERDLVIKTLNSHDKYENQETLINKFSSKGPFARFDPRSLHNWATHCFRHTNNSTPILSRTHEAFIYAMATDHLAFENMGKISTELLILRGANSTAFDRPVLESAARASSGKYIELERLSHFGPLENPGLITKHIFEVKFGH